MKAIYRSIEGGRLVAERYRAFLKRWPVPNQQVRVPTSQGETFVIVSGAEDAPALLLLHGGMTNSAMWMGDVAAFARFFRVYCIDLIGEPGLSAPARPALASDAHAVWLDDVLKHLAVGRTSILGISLGGWLALDYAIRRPEKVERVAVLCPGGIGRQKVGIGFATLLSRMFGERGKRRLMERILGRAPADPSPAAQGFYRVRRAHSKAFPAADGEASGFPGRRTEEPEGSAAGDCRRARRAVRFSADETKTRNAGQRRTSGVPSGSRTPDHRTNGKGIGIYDV